MPDPIFYSQTAMPGGYAGSLSVTKSSTEMSTDPTMTNLTAWADQVSAATTDVFDAWASFRDGPMPQSGQPPRETPPTPNRLAVSIEILSRSVHMLRSLANQIREQS